MDEVTATIVRLIEETDLTHRPDVLKQSGLAFLDYLASSLQAASYETVRRMADWVRTFPGKAPLLGQTGSANPMKTAFFQGFQSHYLDLDDAQAAMAGHFSTVLFSVLLAESKRETTMKAFFTAYNVGAEVEGILGGYMSPHHKRQGWHSTGTLGTIGGAGALAKLKGLSFRETATLLSLGATQSFGLGLEAGSDTKPLHAAWAAEKAVEAWELLHYIGITANLCPFNNDNGWQKVFGHVTLQPEAWKEKWLRPGQIIDPGLWMKEHPYCSAAISGAAACKELFYKGITVETIEKVVFHFPPGADKALHYMAPKTGREGKFSMEYVAWQIFTWGEEKDALFEIDEVPKAFSCTLPRFQRVHDLPPVEKTVRRTVVTVETLEGAHFTAEVKHPLGSPERPFSTKEIEEKLERAKGESWSRALMKKAETWPEGTVGDLWELLYEEKGGK